LIPAPRQSLQMASASEMLCCNLQVHHRSPTTRCRTAPPMSLRIQMGCPPGAHQGTGQQAFPRASIRCPRRGSSPLRPQAPCPTTWVGVLDRLACHHILGYPHLDPCLGRYRISGQVRFVVGVSGNCILLKAVTCHQSGCCGHQHISLFVTLFSNAFSHCPCMLWNYSLSHMITILFSASLQSTPSVTAIND